MTPVFADTFFFLALLRSDDRAHLQAKHLLTSSPSIVTTEFVLLELGNACSRAEDHADFIALVKAVRGSSRITVVPLDSRLFDRGLERMANRADKDWSLTDCISFVVMEGAGMMAALTGDNHFEQAGFAAIMR